MPSTLAEILRDTNDALLADRPGDALVRARDALRDHPASGLLHLRIAAAHRALGDEAAAEAAAQAAFALSPGLAWAGFVHGHPALAAERPSVTIVEAGPSAARNQAANAASGTYLLLWEGGRPLLDGWLAELVDLAERSSAAAVLPGDPAAAGGFEVDAAIGPWLLIRRAAFALAGGLDEGYRGGLEVADLAMRLRAMGRRLVYASAGGGSFRAPSQHDAERFQHKWEPWLRGLQSCRPPVTVVMPVFNKVAYTQACLEAYFANTPTGWPELMIVDNASSDETGALLAGLGPEVTVVTNETNRGFARACNQLAAMAGGQYVVFLNNDTLPFPGWLEALVAEAEADAAIGIVGSKLIYPQNGLIQHAGVVLGRGEAPYHVYRNLRVGHGNVNVRRDFDMVTGACLLVRKTMLDAIGGFDEGYVNGYEDVDLCLRARANGWTVRYTPHSILYHFESVSEGRHRFEDENHRRYLRAWSGKFDAKGRLVGR